MYYAAGFAVLLSIAPIAANAAQPGEVVLAQADSTHTLIAPPSNQGRVGQSVTLPQGGTGITAGGTSNYQTLTTPGGGSGVAVANGAGSSTVTGIRGGAARVPR